MPINEWSALALVCLLGAMSPGPSLALVIQQTLANGRRHGTVLAWSHAFGIGLYAALSVLGLSYVLQNYPNLFSAITLLGSVYLVYLGYGAIKATRSKTEKLTGAQAPLWHAVRDGLSMALLSPKIMVFFTALFSQFVALSDGNASWGIILIPLLIDGIWYSFIAYSLQVSSVISFVNKNGTKFNLFSGIILIAIGIWVAFNALP